jgi:hypothetical protein
LLGTENHRVNQLAPESVATEFGSHKQALHLAGVEVVAVGQRPECTAPGGVAIDLGDKQPTMWLGVVARQRPQFLFKTLKTEVDVQVGLVILKQLTHRRQVICGAGGKKEYQGGSWARFGHRRAGGANRLETIRQPVSDGIPRFYPPLLA